MPSIGTLSDYTLSSGPSVKVVEPSLRRIAQSLTADPIVFLEINARENVGTDLEEIVSDPTGTGLIPLSSGSLSSMTLPHLLRSRKSYLFATRPWTGGPNDKLRPNERAIPRLQNGGRITRIIPIDATNRRRGTRNIGDATIVNPDGELDFLLTENTLEGGSVRAWLAEPHASTDDWVLIYKANISAVQATQKEIRISISTIQDELDRNLQLRQYTGSGGIAGDSNVAGRLKPICIGYVWGAAPVLISKADNIYAVSDGSIQSIDWVAEGGLFYTYTENYATFDDLQAATLSSGEYATCLSEGLFRIGTTLAGLVYPIRFAAEGDNTVNGYVSDTGEILYRVARTRAFISGNNIDLAAFQGLPQQAVGYYFNGTRSLKCSDVFNALLGGVVGWYGVGRENRITVGQVLPASFQNNAITVRQEQIITDRVEARADELRLSQPYLYAPTWDPLSADQISPLADASMAQRLQEAVQTGEAIEESDLAISPRANPVLMTYFTDQKSADQSASDALLISSQSGLPVQANIGRRGLEVDIGQVIGIQSNRWGRDFRGIIYEQEDDLGAVVNTRVTAIG